MDQPPSLTMTARLQLDMRSRHHEAAERSERGAQMHFPHGTCFSPLASTAATVFSWTLMPHSFHLLKANVETIL